MSKLLLTFYGDDFTGSTDALEQLAQAGVRAALFIEPPTPQQLARFKNLRAVGVAGKTRSMTPTAMEKELRSALRKLKALGARHVHYKVCSTFDSAPGIGSIGRAIDVATRIFCAPFVPVLVAAPALGRYTVFGNHFARYGIGSEGRIHRLDHHPSISKHPVTPMTEADLRLHLSKQTKKDIRLVDILTFDLREDEARTALSKILQEAEIVLFDAITNDQLRRIGLLVDRYASYRRPMFWIGSSGIEIALTAAWKQAGTLSHNTRSAKRANSANQILVGSGSCALVTSDQIAWALKHGFREVELNARALASAKTRCAEIHRATAVTASLLASKRNVIVHTTKRGADKSISAQLNNKTAQVLGTALGEVLRGALAESQAKRICVAGGDTSSYVARALGIEALEMIAPLTPGAPLCRAYAPGSPLDQREVIFKGGQVGSEDYFSIALKGRK